VKVTERGAVSGRQYNVRASGWKSFLGPWARIVLAAVLVVGAVAAVQVVVKLLKGVLSLGGVLPALYYLAYLLVSVLVCYFVYRAYVRLVERRPVGELSGAGASRELGIGAAIGLGLVVVVVGSVLGAVCFETLDCGHQPVSEHDVRRRGALELGLKFGVELDVTTATGPTHVQAKYAAKPRPLRKIVLALGWLVDRIKFSHEAI